MADRISRRRLLVSGSALLVGCDRVFSAIDGRVSERAERALFRKHKLAREEAESRRTALDAFPQYFVGSEIPLAPAGWKLAVTGLVAQPLMLSLDELQRLERMNLRVRHYCVEGWSAVADWHGVRLSEIARVAQVLPAARCVEFHTFDVDENGTPYSSSWDLESALHPQTILAYGMNGQPLPPGHGAPLRLYSAVKLGYKMAKYLREIRFTPAPTGGYWEDQGYEWFAGV